MKSSEWKDWKLQIYKENKNAQKTTETRKFSVAQKIIKF